jgi:hypothetical protein
MNANFLQTVRNSRALAPSSSRRRRRAPRFKNARKTATAPVLTP